MCERIVCKRLCVEELCVEVCVCVFKFVRERDVCVTNLHVKELCVEVCVNERVVCV